MKKLFFFAAIIFYGSTFGQELNEKLVIKKGTFNIGGKVSFSLDNMEDDYKTYKRDDSSFEFNPNLGYTIKNNLMIGLGLGYSHFKSKSKDYDVDNSIEVRSDATSHGFSVFPYVKKYISLGDKLVMFLQGEFRYSEVKNENNYSNILGEIESSRNSLFIGFRPGISYFLTKKLAIEANLGALGYTKLKSKNSGRGNHHKADSFDLNLNASNLQFGFSYFF